jgi:protein SCO1/2
MRIPQLATIAFVGALVVGGAGCGSDEDGSRALHGVVRTPALDVSAVVLPDVAQGGQATVMRAPDRQLYLVYFGYTSCPDVCPTTLNDLRVAIDDLPDDLAGRVTVAMATVDPERDTEATLTAYLGHFFNHSIALRTTDEQALKQAADVFGVKFEVGSHQQGQAYNVAHTAVTYVIDDHGKVVVEWPFGLDNNEMTRDLRILLTKETP